MLINFTIVLLGYLFGSIATAIIICKVMRLEDPRRGGSGNPGATNVLRMHGKKAAILSLLGDVLKGILPVLLAKAMQMPDWVIALTGLAAFLGHLYPVFFGFRGGKGVATLVGVLIATHWLLGLAYLGTWLLMALLFRISSLSAIIAAAMTPFYTWWLLAPPVYVVCFSLMAAGLIWRHRSNIKKLLAGNEDKMGSDKN